jgi:hypothetical protein
MVDPPGFRPMRFSIVRRQPKRTSSQDSAVRGVPASASVDSSMELWRLIRSNRAKFQPSNSGVPKGKILLRDRYRRKRHAGLANNLARSDYVSGAPGGIRTPDPLLRRQMLYPTELRAHPWLLCDSTALAHLNRVPTPPNFRSTSEQYKRERQIRCPLFRLFRPHKAADYADVPRTNPHPDSAKRENLLQASCAVLYSVTRGEDKAKRWLVWMMRCFALGR